VLIVCGFELERSTHTVGDMQDAETRVIP
jgi:hypothetical protein